MTLTSEFSEVSVFSSWFKSKDKIFCLSSPLSAKEKYSCRQVQVKDHSLVLMYGMLIPCMKLEARMSLPSCVLYYLVSKFCQVSELENVIMHGWIVLFQIGQFVFSYGRTVILRKTFLWIWLSLTPTGSSKWPMLWQISARIPLK